MNSKFRLKVFKKIAQTAPNQLNQTSAILPPPPALPTILYSYLAEGYNGATIPLLVKVSEILGNALYYASNGKSNFQKIIDNNLDLSGALPDEKHIGMLSKRFYATFLNNKNPFAGKRVDSNMIRTWADTIINSQEFNSLSSINPTSILSNKLGGNLKTLIFNYLNQIKQLNPSVT